MHSTISGEKDKVASDLWRRGWTAERIADEVGIPAGRIINHATRHRKEYPKRYRGTVVDERDRDAHVMAAIMRSHGMSLKSIASELGFHPSAVQSWLGWR